MKILLIGGGLAGCILADKLAHLVDVTVVDALKGASSSRVAAGIYNPVTGRRMSKSWLVDELNPVAQAYYTNFEEQTQTEVLKEIDIIRVFHNEGHAHEWKERIDLQTLNDIKAEDVEAGHWKPNLNDDFGSVKTSTSWQLNTTVFLDKIQSILIEKGVWLNEVFTFEDLKLSINGAIWKDEIYQKVVFAEGATITENPYFKYLPLRPNKGELLIIEAPDLELSEIAMRGVFVLPLGNNIYKVGATYNNRQIDYLPSFEGEEYLLEKLNGLIKVPFKVIDHQAGVRPATHDRRPYLGEHPKEKNLFVFNGFGSKGVSLIPYLADSFVEYMINQKPIPEEVAIERCLKYYNK